MNEPEITPTAAENQPTATKRCPRCGEVKPLSEFYKSAMRKDGHTAYCRVCQRAINAEYSTKKKPKITPPQSVTAEPHPIFSKMQPREIQSEIRERVNYLRSTGWECEVKFRYTQVKEVTI